MIHTARSVRCKMTCSMVAAVERRRHDEFWKTARTVAAAARATHSASDSTDAIQSSGSTIAITLHTAQSMTPTAKNTCIRQRHPSATSASLSSPRLKSNAQNHRMIGSSGVSSVVESWSPPERGVAGVVTGRPEEGAPRKKSPTRWNHRLRSGSSAPPSSLSPSLAVNAEDDTTCTRTGTAGELDGELEVDWEDSTFAEGVVVGWTDEGEEETVKIESMIVMALCERFARGMNVRREARGCNVECLVGGDLVGLEHDPGAQLRAVQWPL